MVGVQGVRTPLPASATFPCPTSTEPFWRTQLHPLDSHRSTPELPASSDVIIIGSGMSGVSTAYHMLQLCKTRSTRPSITILEARQLCSGATGRNGGHLKLAIPHIIRVLEKHGVEIASEVGEFPVKQIYALKEVVDRECIDCDFLLTRSFDVWMDETQAREEEQKVRSLWEAGIDIVKKHVNIIPKEHVEAVGLNIRVYRMCVNVFRSLVSRAPLVLAAFQLHPCGHTNLSLVSWPR